jgi:hypothetical protein
VLEIRDPQIRDPDPRIFTGIRIRRSGSAYFYRVSDPGSGIRDPGEKQCGSPTLLHDISIHTNFDQNQSIKVFAKILA